MFSHLRKTQQKYIPHFKFGFVNGIIMIYGGIISIVHSLVPDLFPFKSEKIVRDLVKKADARINE